MKGLLFMLPAVVCCMSLHAQRDCGTRTPPEAVYDSLLAVMNKQVQRQPQSLPVKYVRVYIVNYLNAVGSDSSWSMQEITQEFEIAKALLQPYDICLVLQGIKHVWTTTLQDADKSDESAIVASSYYSNCVNIYLHKTLHDGSSDLNGTAYDIPSKKLSLSRGAIGNKSLAHELGHCFGLLHVFETNYGLECPDGSNSSSAGDKITDTRATPDDDAHMQNFTNAACIYTGNKLLFCNNTVQQYHPETENIMCYGRRTCRDEFSYNQYQLMNATITAYFIAQSIDMSGSLYVFSQTVDYDAVFAGSYVQIGNSSPTLTTFVGYEGRQKFLSTGQIRIKPGTKITTTTNKAKVVISHANDCVDFRIPY